MEYSVSLVPREPTPYRIPGKDHLPALYRRSLSQTAPDPRNSKGLDRVFDVWEDADLLPSGENLNEIVYSRIIDLGRSRSALPLFQGFIPGIYLEAYQKTQSLGLQEKTSPSIDFYV